jgi:hypothetical protein
MMTPSMLSRLPDIVALARARAHDLMAHPSGALSPRRSAPPGAHHDTDDPGVRRVTMLCGDAMPVLLGLLAGQGSGGSLARRMPLLWLAPTAPAATPAQEAALSAQQRQTRQFLDLAVHLFVARELLTRDGLLVTPVSHDPERCTERLLVAVFGESRQIVPPLQPFQGPPQHGVCIAGRLVDRHLPPMGGPDLLFDLALHTTRRTDTVVVLPAPPQSAGWVAALERQWILV